MKIKRSALWLIILTLTWWLGAGLAQAVEFSANVVTRMKGQEHKGKIYFSGEKMRHEMSTPRGKHITISRLDKKVMWMIMPRKKLYMEMELQPEDLGKNMVVSKEQLAKMKHLGTETVKGYETDKYETTAKRHQGEPVTQYVWIAKKLGVPIKVATKDGNFIMEYQDIKEGEVPASAFEVPKGYRKMKIPPGMPAGMPKGKRGGQ